MAGFRGAGATSALAVVLFIIGITILNSVIYGDLGSSIPSWAVAVLALACAPLARVVVELGLRSSVESSSSTAIESAAQLQSQPKETPAEALSAIGMALLFGLIGVIAGTAVGLGVGSALIVVSGMGGFGAGYIVMGIAGVGALIGMVIGTAIGLSRSSPSADIEGVNHPR